MKRTDDEKKELVKKVEFARQNGLTVEEATKSVGVPFSQYFKWKKTFEGKRKYTRKVKKPDMLTVTAPFDDKMVILIGDPEKVERALNQIYKG